MPEQPPVPTEPVPVPEPPAVVMPDPVPPPAPSGTNWDMVSALADWTAALTTIGAVVVAAVAAYWTIQTNRAQQKTLELQQEQWKRQQEMERREQAKNITFYADWNSSRTVRVLNASSTHVDFCFFVLDGPKDMRKWRILGLVDHLLPTGTDPLKVTLTAVDEDEDLNHWHISMYFVDMNGYEWRRSASGLLREATEQEKAFIIGDIPEAADSSTPSN